MDSEGVDFVCSSIIIIYCTIHQAWYLGFISRIKLVGPEADSSMSITTTIQAISDKILSLNYADFRAEIKSVDSQESINGGVHVLVTGYLTGKDNLMRKFSQTFFLAPQGRGYFCFE
ncbi:hypothetical protein P3S67_005656 [Capsicum chacoense]